MGVSLCDLREVHVDQIAELVAGLVQMQHHERLWILLSDLSDILIPRYLNNMSIFLFLSLDL